MYLKGKKFVCVFVFFFKKAGGAQRIEMQSFSREDESSRLTSVRDQKNKHKAALW